MSFHLFFICFFTLFSCYFVVVVVVVVVLLLLFLLLVVVFLFPFGQFVSTLVAVAAAV